MYIIIYQLIHLGGEFMKQSRVKRAENLFIEEPIARSSKLRDAQFCSKDVRELVSLGYLNKIRRGFYAWGSAPDSMDELELIARLVPQGVIALFSAAQYYNMTTINPAAIEIVLPAGVRTPVLPEHPPVKVYKWIRRIYEIGIETMPQKNCRIGIYSPERTVCDFFRMRRQIGEDASIEVIKNYMNGTKNLQKLYEYADLLQIKTVMRPYVESLL
jgi:predicted transcriptional regulator of viral defense system